MAASLVLAVILLLGMFAVQYILPFTGGGIRPLADQTAFPALTLEELERCAGAVRWVDVCRERT